MKFYFWGKDIGKANRKHALCLYILLGLIFNPKTVSAQSAEDSIIIEIDSFSAITSVKNPENIPIVNLSESELEDEGEDDE